MSFTGIYWVLLGFTGFYWVFILFQLFFFDITLVLMDFNGSNGFYRVWIESTQGWPRFARFFNSIRSWFYFFFYRDWLDAIGSKKVSAEFFEVPTRKFTEFYWVLSVFYGVPEWVHPNMVLLTFFLQRVILSFLSFFFVVVGLDRNWFLFDFVVVAVVEWVFLVDAALPNVVLLAFYGARLLFFFIIKNQ